MGTILTQICEEILGGCKLGIAEALDSLSCEEGGGKLRCRRVHLILSLPTGYGKSTISLVLAKALEKHGHATNFARVIHVAPTRALIEDLHRRAKDMGIGSAVQYSYAPMDSKAPYFLPRLTITTYDSYTLNLYKAVIAERRSEYGHFELPRFAIYSALTHLDEYHLLALGDDEGDDTTVAWTTLKTTAKQLASAGAQLILSTATPSKPLEEDLATALKAYSPPGTKVLSIHVVPSQGTAARNRNCDKIGGAGRVATYRCRLSDDLEYTLVEVVEELDSPNIELRGITSRELETEAKRLVEATRGRSCNCTPQLLVVANTVNRAAEIYRRLKSAGIRTCLVHGRMTTEHRESVLNRARNGECETLVTTQVIEVGVDLNACSIITDAAPLPSLVQRIGRVLRKPDCAGQRGEALVITDAPHHPYDRDHVEKTLKLLEEHHWRICLKQPYGCGGAIGYAQLIDRVYPEPPQTDPKLEAALKALDEDVYTTKKDLYAVLDQVCGLVRTTALMTLAAPGYNLGEPDTLRDKLLTVASTALISLVKKAEDPCKLLRCRNGDPIGIISIPGEAGGRELVEAPVPKLGRILRRLHEAQSEPEVNRELCRAARGLTVAVDGKLGELVALVLNHYDEELGLA